MKNTEQIIRVMDFLMEMCRLMTENDERQLKYQEGLNDDTESFALWLA